MAVRRHRHDAGAASGAGFALANRRRRFDAAHLGHLDVHQHDVVAALLELLERFQAVVGDLDAVAAPRQQADRHPLVDDVVFGEQDARALDRLLGHVGRRLIRLARQRVCLQRVAHRDVEIGLPDRLGQIRADAELAAARRVAELPRRGQHHDRRAARSGCAAIFSATVKPSISACSRRAAPARTACRDARRRPAPRAPRRPLSTATGFIRQRVSISLKMRRFTSLSSTISTGSADQHRVVAARRQIRHLEARRELEGAAMARLAVHPDPAAHQANQRRRDGQAEAGAAEAARRRPVGLAEGLEDRRVLLFRDADAGVGDREAQLHAIAEVLVAAHLHQDVPALGELDGVAYQVGDHLADAPGVAGDAGRHVGGDVGDQLEPLLVGEQGERLHRVFDQLADRERNRFELRASAIRSSRSRGCR
jgi:hypothetical protein